MSPFSVFIIALLIFFFVMVKFSKLKRLDKLKVQKPIQPINVYIMIHFNV